MGFAKHLTNLIAWFIALIALAFYVCMAVGSVNQNNPLQDFHVFYHSAVQARTTHESYKPMIIPQNKWAKHYLSEIKKHHHGSIKDSKKSLYRVGVNLNPPFFSWLLQPLTHLPFHRAYYVWVMLAVIMIYASLRIVVSADKAFSQHSRYVGMAFFLLMTFSPTLMNASCGQLGALFAFVLACAWWLGKKQHYTAMTILLAALASIKLFVAFYVFLLLIKKQYRLALLFVVAGLVFTFLPLLFGFTVHNYVDFVKTILRFNWVQRIAFSNWNISLLSPFARIDNFFAPGTNNVLGHIIKVPLFFLVAGTLWGYTHRLRHLDFKRDYDMLFVLTYLTMFLVCPLSWTYYLISYVLIYFLLIQRALKNEKAQTYILLLSLGLFLSGVYFPFMPHLHTVTVATRWLSILRGSVPFIGFLIVCFVAYQLTSPQTQQQASNPLCDKQMRFALFSGYALALIPGLYTMDHMMHTALSIFIYVR